MEKWNGGIGEQDRRILELVGKGLNQSEIARELGVVRNTVSNRIAIWVERGALTPRVVTQIPNKLTDEGRKLLRKAGR